MNSSSLVTNDISVYRPEAPHFNPTPAQLDLLRTFAAGHAVADLGAGRFLAGTVALLDLGATHVHAYDRIEEETLAIPVPRGATYVRECLGRSFKAPSGCSRALVSWPVIDILIPWSHILSQFELVAYMGINNGSSSCGNRHLWRHFGRREILFATEGRRDRSNFILYGALGKTLSPPRCTEEENARSGW